MDKPQRCRVGGYATLKARARDGRVMLSAEAAGAIGSKGGGIHSSEKWVRLAKKDIVEARGLWRVNRGPGLAFEMRMTNPLIAQDQVRRRYSLSLRSTLRVQQPRQGQARR